MLVFLLYFSLCLHSDVTPASSMKTTDITSVYFRAPVCRIKGEEPEMKAFVHSTCRTTCGNKIINECVRLREREEERETGTYNHITRLEGLFSCFWGHRKFRIFLSARQGLLLEGEGGAVLFTTEVERTNDGCSCPSLHVSSTHWAAAFQVGPVKVRRKSKGKCWRY